VEFVLLRRTLNERIGRTGLPASLVARLWLSAAAAAAVAWGVKELVGPRPAILLAVLTIVPYGVVYFGVTAALGVPEVRTMLGRLTRRMSGSPKR
jgi:putative peptidoglycan lipid II flippase